MSKKIRITIMIVTIIIILITVIMCNSNSKVEGTNIIEKRITLYSLEGRTLEVFESEVDTYLKLDWYLEPVTTIYNARQEQIIIYQKDKPQYMNLEWYEYPVMYVYNSSGSAILIRQYEKNEYLNKGYYLEPPQVDSNDMILLAKVIYAESTQVESLRILDRQYVGAVVMNRVRHPLFPNTVSGVIYARGQYSCVGNRWFNQDPPQECLDIAKQLLLGETFGVPSNVVFQAQFIQGKGVWRTVGVHYYCYI